MFDKENISVRSKAAPAVLPLPAILREPLQINIMLLLREDCVT